MSDEPALRRRGPYAKSRVRRRDIGTATLDLVIERGHQSVSVADVARRCGLAEATVLYHCPTKDDLFVAALEERDARERGQALGLAGGDLEAMIRQITSDGVAHPNSRRLFAVMSAAATDPGHPARPYIRRRQQEAVEGFGDLLRRRQEAGLAHPEVDPRRFGQQMVAIWDGLQLHWLTGADIDLTEEVVAAFRTLARQDAMVARRAIEALAAEL